MVAKSATWLLIYTLEVSGASATVEKAPGFVPGLTALQCLVSVEELLYDITSAACVSPDGFTTSFSRYKKGGAKAVERLRTRMISCKKAVRREPAAMLDVKICGTDPDDVLRNLLNKW